jgi:hypothetical protein
MSDVQSLSATAETAVALLSRYLDKDVEAEQLYELVQPALSKNPAAKDVLQDLELHPTDRDLQAALRAQLKKAMTADAEFAQRLTARVKHASTVSPLALSAVAGSPPDPPRSGPIDQFLQPFVTTRLWLGILLLFTLGLIVVAISFTTPFLPQETNGINFYTYIIREAGAGLIVAALVVGPLRLLIVKFYDLFEGAKVRAVTGAVTRDLVHIERAIRQQAENLLDTSSSIQQGTVDLDSRITGGLGEVQSNLQQQTASFLRSSASLQAMHESGILQLYASRAAASADMAMDLQSPAVTKLRLIGISLNDFVRGDQPELFRAWMAIENYIDSKSARSSPERNLDIQILIIDPECLGAELRSVGEERDPRTRVGRLGEEVRQTAERLAELEKMANFRQDQPRVSLKCRLYRLPPILFLCQTDVVTYVQPYHFWRGRSGNVDMPVIKCQDTPHLLDGVTSLHRTMQYHFDWIWENASASIGVSELIEGRFSPIDNLLTQAGAMNVFSDPERARARILRLLRQPKNYDAAKVVCIQGVSLISFFRQGQFLEALGALLATENVSVRVLILDPECDQARYRSYREFLINRSVSEPAMAFEEYRNNPEYHTNSQLYQETQASIREARRLMAAYGVKVEVRKYESAPSFFMLLVDENVLVEQYHYGTMAPRTATGGHPLILGKDMPLLEFSGGPVDRFGDKIFRGHPLRIPYELMRSHFDFVFEECARAL